MPPTDTVTLVERLATELYGQALDLTLRNPLLSLPDITRSARFIDLSANDPDLALKAIIDNGRPVQLVPSDASALELRMAQQSRIVASDTLRLTTALPRDRLLNKQKTLRRTNEELIEKRGLPCGYIAYGALSWETLDGTHCRSPLVLIPVDIDEVIDQHLRRVTIQLTPCDRDVLSNPALAAYMRKHFGIAIPQLTDAPDTDQDPEAIAVLRWRRKLEPVLKTFPEWSIEPFLALGLFDSGAISADCDNSRWSRTLGSSLQVAQLLLGTHTAAPPVVETEFLPSPLVLDADGSQLAALKRIRDGESLVIHGPPGSGKSQTIVNTIASAMAQEKSVLFVAQKPEAALVVHRRMQQIGLAPFCTMLIPVGTKANLKQAVLEGLRARDGMQLPRAYRHEQERARLAAAVEVTDGLATALRRQVASLGLCARDIVARAAVLRHRGIDVLDPTSTVIPHSPTVFAEAESQLELLATTHAGIEDECLRTVGGLRPLAASTDVNHLAAQFCRAVATALAESHAIHNQAEALSASTGIPIPGTLRAIARWLGCAPPLTRLTDTAFRKHVSTLLDSDARSSLEALLSFKRQERAIVADQPRAAGAIAMLMPVSDVEWSAHHQALHDVQLLSKSVGELADLSRRIEACTQWLRPEPSQASPALETFLSQRRSFDGWQSALRLLEEIGRPTGGRSLTHRLFGGIRPALDAIVQCQQLAHEELACSQALAQVALIDDIPARRALVVSHSQLMLGRSLASRMWRIVTSHPYREAQRCARALVLPHVPRREWAAILTMTLRLHDVRDRLAATLSQVCRDRVTARELDNAVDWLSAPALASWMTGPRRTEAWRLIAECEDTVAHSLYDRTSAGARHVLDDSELLLLIRSILGPHDSPGPVIAERLSFIAAAAASVAQQAKSLGLPDSTAAHAAIALGNAARGLRRLHADCNAHPGIRDLVGTGGNALDTDATFLVDAHDWITTHVLSSSRAWQSQVQWALSNSESQSSRLDTLITAVARLTTSLYSLNGALDALRKGYDWGHASADLALSDDLPLTVLHDRCQRLSAHASNIVPIFRLAQHAERARQIAGPELVSRLLAGVIAPAELVDTYRATVFECALRSEPALAPIADFDIDRTEQALTSIESLDGQLRRANATAITHKVAHRDIPEGVSVGRVADKTELGLIRHLLGLQRPRTDLHSLYRRAGRAMSAMQPCTIATPTTVSEYLPRDLGAFDLVIIDEASQVLPAAALGAVARGKQTVIVGDPKQLPPTSFFTSETALAEDDDSELADTKSILDKAIGALPNVYLKGHYRSRHHSLIDFSNRHFYARSLVVVPSTAPRSQSLGVVAHRVANAIYSAGQNEAEARAVATAAMQQLRHRPDESLGIVAFNVQQASLIETHLEALAQQSARDFELYVRARKRPEPLFVRSLESVQGDERDVIFISYTYGRSEPNGPVYQRFGPLLRDGGERRLNVLVTRAKNRVEVFHSMAPSDITAQGAGAVAMREYLMYAMRAPEHDFADGDYESPFEQEVALAIEGMASNLQVRSQVGCAGFRIDLGVCLRHDPNRFVLGIECDGASYHSEPSARQRDLVRQQILEQHQWRIHRIWSTAWWHNPHREMERLREVLAEVATISDAR